jgi:hypothetical protein
VITIVGLAAFIVGGGVALVEDGSQPPSASNAPAVSVSSSSSTPALESPPASNAPSVSLAEDENEGDENGHGGHGKAKGHDKKGHEGHGRTKGHQGNQGEED